MIPNSVWKKANIAIVQMKEDLAAIFHEPDDLKIGEALTARSGRVSQSKQTGDCSARACKTAWWCHRTLAQEQAHRSVGVRNCQTKWMSKGQGGASSMMR